jgi:hypothetical protein
MNVLLMKIWLYRIRTQTPPPPPLSFSPSSSSSYEFNPQLDQNTPAPVYQQKPEPVRSRQNVGTLVFNFVLSFCFAGVTSDSVHQQETGLLSEPCIQANLFGTEWKILEQ